jgi:hypothetical protein
MSPLQENAAVIIISALIASVLSSLASQPGDTLLSAVNKSFSKNSDVIPAQNALSLTLDTMRSSIKSLGVRGLFVGAQVRMLHVITIVLTQLVVYDFLKETMGLPLGH